MRKLYVIGTGGLAKETAHLALQINALEERWTFCGYIGAPESKMTASMPFAGIAGDDNWLLSQKEEADIVLGLGQPSLRRKIAEHYKAAGCFSFPNLAHPTLNINKSDIDMGIGNVFAQGVASTCDIKIGDFNLFNLNSTIGHDDQIGSFNVINPGTNLSGNVTLGDEILIGTGVQILENITVASKTIIGAGSVLTKSVDAEGGVYVGIPAKRRP